MSANTRSDFIERARRDAHAIAGLDLALPLDDLAPLAAIVGDARIVGIGESWHHAREILQLRYRFVRFLIERLGFNTVVFEGSVTGSAPLDSYVLGGTGDGPTALSAFGQPMWLNPETVEFIDWLRAYNAAATAASKVHTFGIDVGYPAAAIFAVLSYLDRVDNGYAVPHRDIVADIGQALQRVRFGSLTKSAMHGSSDIYDKLDPATKDRFRAAFVDIIARLQLCKAGYTAQSSRSEHEQMLRYATLVLQAHAVIGTRSSNLGLANDGRDYAFAENVDWIAERMGRDARLVVLAHNMHIARDPFKSAPRGPSISSMAGHLARWYAHDYVAIGTAVGRGRLRGGDPGLAAAPPADDTIRQALVAGSIDAALEEVGGEHFLLDVPAGLDWAQQPHCMRSHLDPQPEYVLANAFDAVAYLDKLTRAAPIASDERAA